ncbi:MAG: NADH-quinone oxidoreductase subunit C [Deferribacterota bacterium]|nr:NADH-quinone oxidoreductase subunit C [Deferribacterota bacterium]
MNFDEICNVIRKDITEDFTSYVQFGCNFLVTSRNCFKDIIKKLRDSFTFEYLVDIVGVHYPDNSKYPFEVVYNQYSITNNIRVLLKVPLKDENIETVTDLYKSAMFLEREQYDMVGIKFIGHPDLRRILMPDFFKKHPLRKDFDLKDRSWYNDADEQGLGIKYKNL